MSSIYVKLEEENEKVSAIECKSKGELKKPGTNVIPPQKPYTIPSGDYYDGYGESLFSTSQEYTRPIHCEVIGEIPLWINGSFIRLAPGRFEWGETECGHFFDGDALAHRFTISDGAVSYESKFLDSEYHRKNKKYNRISAPGFGTWAPPDPCANIFRRIAMYFVPQFNNDNTNVNLFNIQGKTYCATETPWMLEIDPNTLETIKIINGRNQLSSTTGSWLAHPHFEPDGSTWMFSTSYVSGQYELIKIPPTPSGSDPLHGISVFKTLDFDEGGPCYYHSFAYTENYIILIENPLSVDTCEVLTMNLRHKSVSEILKYRPEYGTKFRIVDKRTGKELRTCRAEPFFVFHVGNSYETEDDIIIDLCAYEDDSVIKLFYLTNSRKYFKGMEICPPNLQRYRIPKIEIMKEDPEPFRFPVILSEGFDHEIIGPSIEGPVYNYDMVNGKEYSYLYGINAKFTESYLVKVNVKTKECLYWYPPEKCVPGLPIFIQKPGGKHEDEGVIVSTVIGVDNAFSFFIVLDARTMGELGRANMPVQLGLGIHGNFFPS